MPILDPDQRHFSRLLGDSYPYWWSDKEGRIHVEDFSDQALNRLDTSQRAIDPVAILSMLSFEYICLDRTLVRGVQRLPWLGEVDGCGAVRFEEAPPHEQRNLSAERISKRLRRLLEEEVAEYCRAKNKVYLLLSGGMDSRVMAGIVAELQRSGDISAPVEAVTWGVRKSRDVQYAQAICRQYGWRWHWAELNAKTYWDTFQIAAEYLGAEIDPKHLHRMDWFRDADDNSVVLAASYGDSVGRAEFSSWHLTQVTELAPQDRNRLLRPAVREWAWPRLVEDIRALRGRHGNREMLGWREIERQAHYMRRMLCSTMNIINRWTELRQIFVAPAVFEFMWSLSPEVRTDEVYVHLLRSLDTDLLELPWARTGARYDTGEGRTDEYCSKHHMYGYWLRSEHADKIANLLFDGTLERLEIFDMDQVQFMYDEWLRERPKDDTSLCTQLSWAATLSRFAARFEIEPFDGAPACRSFPDMAANLIDGRVARASQVARRVTRPVRMTLKTMLD